MQNNLRVSAYCRVSTEKDDQINSLVSQIKYFTDYIKQHECWTIGEVYYDEGITGTSTRKREGFNRMIRNAEMNQMDLILTKEVSRFARNTVDTLSYTRALKSMGVGVIFTLDNIDTRENDGELRLSIMASLAQEESRKTSERVKWGHKRRMEQGIVFGRDLLGYSVRNGKLYLNQEESEIVRLIFHKYLVEEKGTHVIARELHEADIAPKRVQHWSNTVILRVLRNEKYVGDLLQKKTFTPDYLTHAKKVNRGQEEMIYIKNHHEPIISRDIWDAAQTELERRSSTSAMKSKHSNRYWCSGKLVCGCCGSRFISFAKKMKGGTSYKAWRCYAAARHGCAKLDIDGSPIGCDNSSINDRILLYGMSYVLKHIQSNKEQIINEMFQELQSIQEVCMNLDTDTAPLCQKIERLNQKKRKAIDLILDELITKEDFRKQTEYYDQEIMNLEKQIKITEHSNLLKKNPIDGIQHTISEVKKMMSFETANEMLYRELIDYITIFQNNEMVIYLKCIPYGIRIHTVTSGRLDDYKINITNAVIET